MKTAYEFYFLPLEEQKRYLNCTIKDAVSGNIYFPIQLSKYQENAGKPIGLIFVTEPSVNDPKKIFRIGALFPESSKLELYLDIEEKPELYNEVLTLLKDMKKHERTYKGIINEIRIFYRIVSSINEKSGRTIK